MTQDSPTEEAARRRLRSLRIARGWSIDELARRSDISASTISRLETGHRRLALDHLVILAQALDTTIDELLADSEPGGATFTDEEREQLAGAGIRIVDGRIAAVAGPGRGLKSIVLTDGTTVDVTGLLVPAPHEIRRPSRLEGLGLDFTPTGHIATDGFGATSIDGIWAAGDLASPMSNVARAIAAGSDSAVAITRHLVANTGYRPSGKEAAPSNR